MWKPANAGRQPATISAMDHFGGCEYIHDLSTSLKCKEICTSNDLSTLPGKNFEHKNVSSNNDLDARDQHVFYMQDFKMFCAGKSE